MKPYKKLSEIQELTPIKYIKKFYQQWDDTNKKYLHSETPIQGYSTRHLLETSDFLIHISSQSLGEMLAENFDGNKSEILNKTYTVWNNGKQGKEIRYRLYLKNAPNSTPKAEMASLPTPATKTPENAPQQATDDATNEIPW